MNIPNEAGGMSGFRDGELAPVGERCRFLRHKKMFYDFDREAALTVGPESGGTPYWCVKTSTPLGPDDLPATGEECRAGRSCCET